jgi:exodeoxyribonuclease III
MYLAFKIASWNVAGLRALLKSKPDALSELCRKHDLDVLCLQETKLQEVHVQDPTPILIPVPGYNSYFSCSTAKKGYSGTAVFVKKRREESGTTTSTKRQQQTTIGDFFGPKKTSGDTNTSASSTLPIDAANLIPQQVSYRMGKDQHDVEGRVIVLDFPLFSIVNVYVPNSGQTLQRLSYRTEEWDKDLLEFCQKKRVDRGLPVMWLGDLNVAHTNLEVWNDGAKHLATQAGVTAEERASFTAQLDAGFIDAFRRLHPDAKGHYSYWSQRAGNREPNKGLRLDYFICDPSFFEETSKVVARDSYIDCSQLGSDHCPVILELEIKP